MDEHPATEPTPGIPGLLGRLHWVDSPDFGGRAEDRRAPHTNDVDPAPLARLVAVKLGIIDGDLGEAARAIAEDERDGPVHMAHLLAACQYGAVRTGGSIGSVARGPASEPFSDLCRALLKDGQAATATAAKSLSQADRAAVLEVLLSYLVTPLTGLATDLHDDMLRATR
jgi:hypothetical protein